MWFTGIIFEILFSFYTLNAFLVEKPHRRSVYAVFPYLDMGNSRSENFCCFVIFQHCYHGFQDNTAVKQPRKAKGKSVTNSRSVVKMLSNRVKGYKVIQRNEG